MTGTRLLQLSGRKSLDAHTFTWNIKFRQFQRSFPHVKYGGLRWDVSFREISTQQPNSESKFWLIVTASYLKEPFRYLSLHPQFVASICDDSGSTMWTVTSEMKLDPFTPALNDWMDDMCLQVPGSVICSLIEDSSRCFLKLAFNPREWGGNESLSAAEDDQASLSSDDEESVSTEQIKEWKMLSASIGNLMLDSEDADVTLDVSGTVFRAHKVILRARSPVFSTMFKHDMAERQTGQVVIPDCDGNAFRKYLCYIYSGIIDGVTSENAYKLHYIARKYGSYSVARHCLEFMQNNLTVSSFVEFVSTVLSGDSDDQKLLMHAVKFFSENFNEIGESAEWNEFFQSNPLQANELIMKAHKMSLSSLQMKDKNIAF